MCPTRAKHGLARSIVAGMVKGVKKKSEIVQNLQFEMREEEAKLMNPVLKEVNDTIAKVAKQKSVTIVVNKALVYYGGIDLTQDVVNALKK